jgi:hypothetical protein
MKYAVFGGDLFWSNMPYEVLNFYEDLLNKGFETDLILFKSDFRLTKVFTGGEKFYFDVKKYQNCKNIKIVENWDEFYKITSNYSKIFCSAKVAPSKPRVRYPWNLKRRSDCEIVAWDIGGVDLLVDSHHFANKWIVKGSIWKDFILEENNNFKNISPDDIEVGSCPLYERYTRKDLIHGKLLEKELFFKKYNLDSNRKNILICPSNPSSHTAQFTQNIEALESILDMCHDNGYQCIVKTYPHDYIFYEKEEHLNGLYKRKNHIMPAISQYDYFTEEYGDSLVIIESQDHHESVLYSDLMFNMAGSSIAWETHFSDCNSFTLNFSDKPYFNKLSYLPGLVLPDSMFNFEPEHISDIFSFERDLNLIEKTKKYFS